MRKYLPIILSIVLLGITANAIHAQQEITTGDRQLVVSGNSDETGNLGINLSGDPGETLTGTSTVTNLSNDTLKILTEFEDFIVESETGIPTSVEAGSSVWSMSLWLSVHQDMKEFTLEPNESREIPFTIDIPQDATPGGHYTMILFTPEIVEEDVIGPLIEHKLGNLIKLVVSGDIKESAQITELSAPYFSEYGPIPLQLKILNDGNTHVSVEGKIRIYNMFNKQVAEWDLKPGNIFPTAIRTWDTEWVGKWRFGLYKAGADLTYGSTDAPISEEFFFWVVPWKIILGIVTVIVILLTLGYNKEKKKKKVKKSLPTDNSISTVGKNEENLPSV